MKQLDQDAGGQPGPKPTQATSVVVVVHEGEHLSVFAADVTAAFLAKLDEPDKPPPPGASMDIHQQRMPFHPYETFTGRYAGAVRDKRHQRRPDDQDAGENHSEPREKGDSARLCVRQRAFSVDNVGANTAEPGETDVKRKYSNGTDPRKVDRKENQDPSKAKRRREGRDVFS